MQPPFLNPFDRDYLFQATALNTRPPLVNPLDATTPKKGGVSNTFFEWALNKKPPKNSEFQRPDSDSDYNNPSTFHERIFRRTVSSPGTASDSWRAEVCRFAAPLGSTGVIRAVEQYLSVGDTVYSASAYWGDPEASSFGTWIMRLQLLPSRMPEWISSLNDTTALPGTRYLEWEPSDGLWCPAGSAAAQHHHMVVPAGYLVRVFWLYDGTQDDIPRVGCQLRGSVHNQFAAGTKDVLRSLW